MDLSRLHAVTNNYHDVKLVSLREWSSAHEFTDCDVGGPYMVVQEGYAPGDFTMAPDEFVLGKSGEWLSFGVFLKLPRDERRREFVFSTAAEVIERLENLPVAVKILRDPENLPELGREEHDDLPQAFASAKTCS